MRSRRMGNKEKGQVEAAVASAQSADCCFLGPGAQGSRLGAAALRES